MNTITNEQIKQAFERPELLRELFPNAFKLNLEAGKWYFRTIITGGEGLFNFSGKFSDCGKPLGYGFDTNKRWYNLDDTGWSYATIRPATFEEVETALINEAKKKGYCDAKIIDGCKHATSNLYFYQKSTNSLYKGTKTGPNIAIFYYGRWAEIVKETEIELTLDEVAKKFGVDKVKIKK